jgi:signal transduction histidine kinase
LHIYCGAAELKRVTSLHSAMQIELTDAGARAGDLFIYSQLKPVVKDATGVVVVGLTSAGENVWKLSLKERRAGEIQRVELGIPQPVTRQAWFWIMCGVLLVSLIFSGWRYVVWQRTQLALSRLEQTTARQQERSRIAKDIHDDIGASLTRILLHSKAARREMSGQPARLPERLEAIETTAVDMTRVMDEIVWAVNPRNDTFDGLVTYLGRYAEEFLKLAGLRCRLDLPLDMPAWSVEAKVRHGLFLAFKEALNNVAKHAAASTVRVSVRMVTDGFELSIEDDGKGFKVGSGERADRNGLDNMRSRLAEIGGACVIESEPGRGTCVRFRMAERLL